MSHGRELAVGQSRVWWCRPVPAADPRTAELLHLLDEDELGRRQRFARAEDRDLFTTAHALARCAVARTTGGPPRAGSVRARRYCRPVVTDRSDLDLSISHTAGLVTVALARGARCGVDVETVEAAATVPPSVLAAGELRALPSDPHRRAQALCRYWTLKEAISKVSGQGLGLAFAEVLLTDWDEPPRITSGHAAIMTDTPDRERWLLRHRLIGRGVWGVSVAIRTTDGRPPAEPAWHSPGPGPRREPTRPNDAGAPAYHRPVREDMSQGDQAHVAD